MSTEGIPVSNANPFRGINDAKEILLKERKRLESALKHYDTVIAAMEAHEQGSRGSLDNLPPIRKDEFRGVRAVQALESYLRIRRGFRIPLSRIVKDLVEGGVDPGQPRGKKNDPAGLVAHTLKIAVPNRRDTFGYEPSAVNEKTGAHVIPKGVKDEEIIIWLADTADQAKRRRRVK